MTDKIESRVITIANHCLKTGCTVRQAAKEFGVSKSTVHADISGRLKKIDPIMYREVRYLLDTHLEERHVRGGQATKRKYEELARARKQ